MRKRLSWLFIVSQTNNTQDGPFFPKLRLSVLAAKIVKDRINQGRGPFISPSPVTFQLVSNAFIHNGGIC
jgi:hypothetical protein